MKKLNMLTSALALVLAGGAASANTIQCGTTYTVKSGDYLTKIAKNAYGDTSKFTLIFSANSNVIGSNPGNILVGQKLTIPCLDAPVAASTANASAITDTKTTAAIPAPDKNRPIRLIAAKDWPPYMDVTQEQGGMLTEIVNLAMEKAPGKPAYKIDMIGDDASHINPILVDHAYDLGVGWYKPDCDNKQNLKDESIFRCNNMDYSDPIYEDIMGFYSLSSQPAMQTHEELRGKKICRPKGYSLSALEKNGMAEPAVEIVRSSTEAECIVWVAEGKVDVALVSADAGAAGIATLEDQSSVQLNEALNDVSILYTIVAKTHPRKDEILTAINSGLKDIKESGEWFQIVRRHMTAFRKKNASQ